MGKENNHNGLQSEGILKARDLVHWKQTQGLLKLPSPVSKVIISPQSGVILSKRKFSSKLIKGLIGTHICTNATKGIYLSGGWGVGAPALIAICEELHALGAREFYLAGICGRLTVDVKEGARLIAGAAIREEGTSQHYLPAQTGTLIHCPDMEQLNPLQQSLSADRATFVSTDAPYRETVEKHKLWCNTGATAIDMETAALFAFGAFYNIKTISVAVAADILTEKKWTMCADYTGIEKELSSLIDNLAKTIQ
jgi:uridine phosphorylase